MMRRLPVHLAVAVSLAAVCGCSTPSERRDAATAAARHYAQAVRAGDWAMACAALAPTSREELEQAGKSSCPDALGQEELPDAGEARHTDVHGNQARVVFAQDTVFLARFPSGWKVTAAGCHEQAGDEPYQCEIKGR
ncbi:hypothetical protein [Streptodolium elevatio]|uniref:Lipoprotein n=1 Tax=Streptodolium elevatio TaxID=3157996 RepID=A0ABV3DRA6_9ACTN